MKPPLITLGKIIRQEYNALGQEATPKGKIYNIVCLITGNVCSTKYTLAFGRKPHFKGM